MEKERKLEGVFIYLGYVARWREIASSFLANQTFEYVKCHSRIHLTDFNKRAGSKNPRDRGRVTYQQKWFQNKYSATPPQKKRLGVCSEKHGANGTENYRIKILTDSINECEEKQ